MAKGYGTLRPWATVLVFAGIFRMSRVSSTVNIRGRSPPGEWVQVRIAFVEANGEEISGWLRYQY